MMFVYCTKKASCRLGGLFFTKLNLNPTNQLFLVRNDENWKNYGGEQTETIVHDLYQLLLPGLHHIIVQRSVVEDICQADKV